MGVSSPLPNPPLPPFAAVEILNRLFGVQARHGSQGEERHRRRSERKVPNESGPFQGSAAQEELEEPANHFFGPSSIRRRYIYMRQLGILFAGEDFLYAFALLRCSPSPFFRNWQLFSIKVGLPCTK